MPPKQSRKPSAPPARSKPAHQGETPSPKKGFAYPTQSTESPKPIDSGSRKSAVLNRNVEAEVLPSQVHADQQGGRPSGFAFPQPGTPDQSAGRPSTGRPSTGATPGTLTMAKDFVAATVAGALNLWRGEAQEPETASSSTRTSGTSVTGRWSTGSAPGNALGGVRSRSKSGKPRSVVEEEQFLDPLLSNDIPIYDDEEDVGPIYAAPSATRLSGGPALPPRASVQVRPPPPEAQAQLYSTTETSNPSPGSGFRYPLSPPQRRSTFLSPQPISNVTRTPQGNVVARSSEKLSQQVEPEEEQVWIQSNSGGRLSNELGIQPFVADGTQSAQKFTSSTKSVQGSQVTPQQFLPSQVSGRKTVVMSDSGKESFASPNYGSPAAGGSSGVDRALDLPFPSAERIKPTESESPIGRPSVFHPKASLPIPSTGNASSSPSIATRAATPKRGQQTPMGKVAESPAAVVGFATTPQNRTTASAISRTSVGTSAAKVVAPFTDSTTQFPSPAPAAHYATPHRLTAHAPVPQFTDFSPLSRLLVRLLMVIGILGCLVFAFVISLEPFSDHWKRVLEQPSADQRLGDDSADTAVSFPMVLEASKLPSVQRITQLYQAASHRAEGRAHCSQCITPRLIKEEHRAVLNEMGFNNDDQLREYVQTAANQGGEKEFARLHYILESLIILHQRIRVVTEVYDAPVGAWYWKRFQHFQDGLGWLAGGSLRLACLPRPHTIFWSAVGCMSKAVTELPCPPVELRLFYYQGNYTALLNDIVSEAQAPLPSECRACA
jgi:hypothetical protein